MKKYIIFFSSLIIFILNTAAQDLPSIILSAGVEVQAELIGYEGFSSYPIARIDIQAGEEIEISTDYIGLALLVYPAGQRYPIIMDGKEHQIILEKENSVPQILESVENEFLYHFLANSMMYHSRLRVLETKYIELGAEDSLTPKIIEESLQINKSIDSLYALLPSASYPMASVFIQARLLMESTYSISTLEGLNDRKLQILEYISLHYDYIGHSDMLQELGRQYMMMNEYVGRPKEQLNQDIIQDVSDWIACLEGKVHPDDVVEFFVGTFYNRSMITQASEIVHAFQDIMLQGPSNAFPFQIGDTIPNFSITNGDGVLTEDLNTWDLPKILAIVSTDSKASLAENVILLRRISDKNRFLPIIALTSSGFSAELITMSQLTTGYLFYANDDIWDNTYLGEITPTPFFLLLDEHNVIIAMSRNRKEIFKELSKYMP